MKKEIICEECGNSFEVGKYKIKYSNGRTIERFPTQKYCSLKCYSRGSYKRHRDYYKNYWLSRPNLWAWKKSRECEVCKNEYVPRSPRAKTCSRKCSSKRWKLLNREKSNEHNRNSAKRCRLKDPERYRFYVKNRKHMIRESSGSTKTFSKQFTLKDWDEIMRMFEYKCAICGCNEKLTIDHIIPLSKGGEHNKKNIQPLCHSCNSRKKDKTGAAYSS
jgi:5-methylcytosine-specific restriction endonuclease McrA